MKWNGGRFFLDSYFFRDIAIANFACKKLAYINLLEASTEEHFWRLPFTIRRFPMAGSETDE